MAGPADQTALLKRAYLKLEELQAKLDAAERARTEPLAIVGIGCRFPGGANGPEEFWALLRDGVDAVRPTPTDRWDVDRHFDPTPGTPGKMYSRGGAFLDRVDLFEPQFFGISPREATGMDPQQRLLLEVTWEALEHAGIAPDRLAGSRTGVFVGICTGDYSHMQVKAGDPARFDAYYGSGIAHSVASGRISYVLGLQGPSVSIDTACSSSLVALHLACRSLRSGETNMAIVGGVNLILSPENSITFSRSTMLARDGRCKTFDAAADGFGEGEGCAVVVVKRAADALADGDRVLALIRGTALNQDGASSGLTAPNGPAQVAVIREALADGRVAPAEVGYVEAHGTGTTLGDPIEVQAIGTALGAGRAPDTPVLIGSVKTNLAHLEAAAGLAGVIKVVLSLQHRLIPRHLHFTTPNPHVAWSELPVSVVTENTDWKPLGGTRLAGVSAFGFSGTNAHIVLEQAPEDPASGTPEFERPVEVLVMSGRSDAALRSVAGAYAGRLRTAADETTFRDACHTAAVGRAHLGHRAAVVASSRAAALSDLDAWLGGGAPSAVVAGEMSGVDRPRIAFLFTGQGSQYVGMGRALYDTNPVFRRVLDACDRILRDRFGRALLPVMFAGQGTPEQQLLDDTAWTQPALFALQCGLVELWKAWGIRPSVVLGHSVGEFAAAYAAGVFSLEDGFALIAERARLMQALPRGGKMAAIFAAEARVARSLASRNLRVSIAAINGPENTVISGEGSAVDALCEEFRAEGIGSKALAVSHAFHSPLMEPMLDTFERTASGVEFRPPSIIVVSNVTGAASGPGDLTSGSYWSRHVRQPVRFADSIAALSAAGCGIVVGIGPQPTLISMARACVAGQQPAWLPSLRRGHDEWRQMLGTLAELYARGADVDWVAFDRPYVRRRVSLPTYPFEREPYWIDTAPEPREGLARVEDVHPLLGQRVDSAASREVWFVNALDARRVPFLRDHVVHGAALLPTTGYLEMMAAAARECLGARGTTVRDLSILEPLFVANADATSVQVVCSPSADERSIAIRVFSRQDNSVNWTLHASGVAEALDARATDVESMPQDASGTGTAVDVDAFYRVLASRGLEFGPGFKGVREIRRIDGAATGVVALPDAYPDAHAYNLHPALLDACLQCLAAALPDFSESDHAAPIYMPIALDRFELCGPAEGTLRCVASIPAPLAGAETLTGSVDVFTAAGTPVAHLRGLHLKRAGRSSLERRTADEIDDWFYHVEWRPEPLASAVAGDPVSALASRARSLADENGVAAYDRLNRDLDALCVAYACQALARLGATFNPGERLDRDALGVLPQHRRLLGRLLEILGEEDILSRAGDDWIVVRTPAQTDASALADDLLSRWATQPDELEITKRCGDQLAEALRGQQDPLQLLFPGGDIDRTARIYDASPLARTMNTVAREALLACLAARRQDGTLRVLEVGAGTGGTTQYLLDALPPGSEYVYTDQGQAFLARAARRFADYPFLSFRPLDIEKDPLSQGFTRESFDVVVAANVLHATNSIDAALGRVRLLLKPGGILLLVEGTRPQRWFDLTFGLTDGWWRFEDFDCRPSYPLLGRSGWRAALERAGFERVAVVPEQDDPTALTQTAVMVAHAGAAGAGRSARDAWVVFGDRSGFGGRVAARLSSAGAECLLVHRGSRFARRHDGSFEIDPANPEDYRALMARASEDGLSCRGAIHCWSLDAAAGLDDGADRVRQAEENGCRTALHAVQALLGLQAPTGLQCCLVTCGVQAAGIEGLDSAIPHASMWGFARAVALEHPELRMLRVDLAPAGDPRQADWLVDELQGGTGETEIAYRDGRRLVARLTRATLPGRESDRRPAEEPRRLVVTAQGTSDGVALAPMQRRAPGTGEIEVRVHASALNFRDVLNVLGMRSDDDPLGGECAGVVERVGPGVDGVRHGDAVVAVAAGSFADYVIARADLVFPMPRRLSEEQAAAAPLALLTAAYALESVGQVRRGERVLIHAAAGGVGLAAVQIARRLGAEVFATAGSADKRAFLQTLGVSHVADSRTLDFAAFVAERTNGEGVDVVLNSLTGAAIDAGVRLLRAGGRFLEIGKSDLRTPEAIARLNPNARYHAIDLAGTLHDDPASLRPLVAQLLARLDSGELDPLPVSVFGVEASAEAFRYMARARHIGKVVLRISEDADDRKTSRFRPDATYVITGGLNGIGLETARWMTRRGARHLALIGRRAPAAGAIEAIDDLRRDGVRVMPLKADVTDAARLGEAFDAISSAMPAIRGVIHSAGVLDDGVVTQQAWERFRRVLAPKVDGAWHLHELTRNMPLDFFVLFSSASSLLGSAGQSNHSAANAFLDALAHHRRAAGRPALSINWGAWSEVGAAARKGVEQRIEGHGIRAFSPEQGLRALSRLLDADAAQVGVLPMDWAMFAQHAATPVNPFFGDLARQAQRTARRTAPAAAAPEERAANVVHAVKAAPAHKRRAMLAAHVEATAVRVLGLPPRRPLDRRLPLSEMGLDSLMAVELRNALGTSLEMTLPATLLFDRPSVDALVDYLCEALGFDAGEPADAPQAPTGSAADLLAFVEALSEEDIDRLVTERGVEE